MLPARRTSSSDCRVWAETAQRSRGRPSSGPMETADLTLGAVMMFSLLAPLAGENLLNNPSFEERTPDGRPRGWSHFVMPQPGAFADVDPLSFGGESAVMLHNPDPY